MVLSKEIMTPCKNDKETDMILSKEVIIFDVVCTVHHLTTCI